MKNNKSIKNIFILIIVLNVVALSVYVVLFYNIKSQTEVSSELSSTLAINTSRNQRLNEIEKTIKTIEDRAKTLEQYVLEEDNIVVLLSLLEDAARSKGVVISAEITSSQVAKDTVLSFSYTVNGGWAEVYDFIALVENLPYTTNVKGVTLRKTGSSDLGGIWSGAIKFSVVTG